MDEEKSSTKEGVGGGSIIAGFFVTLALLIMFLWGPIGHYLSRWNGYWDRKDEKIGTIEFGTIPGYAEAASDCHKRAEKQFGTTEFTAFPRKTGENYSIYDCYGVKYTKID